MKTFLHIFLLVSASLSTHAAADNQFVIMSADEIANHQSRMATLQGGEREAYRNRQYQILRERARQNGYILPPAPVWSLPADPRLKELAIIREKHRQTAENHRREMRQRFDKFMAQRPKPPQQPATTALRPVSPAMAPQYRPFPPPAARYPYPPPPPPPPPGYWYRPPPPRR